MMTLTLKFLAAVVLASSYVIGTSGRTIEDRVTPTLEFVFRVNVTEYLKNNTNSTLNKWRQDEGGELGENVVQILTGLLGGGIGNVFEGSSNFIGDTGAQQEVQFILKNVAPSLDAVLKFGYDGLQKYFGTTPRPVVQNGTAPGVPGIQTLQVGVTGVPLVQQQQQQVQQIQPVQQVQQVQPVQSFEPVPVTTEGVDPDPDNEDNEQGLDDSLQNYDS